MLKNISSLERLYLPENPIKNFPKHFGDLRKLEGSENYFKNVK